MLCASVLSLSVSPTHSMSKYRVNEVELIKGKGIKGDAHAGEKVKHRSRVRQNPDQANLRQVHLIHSELFDELRAKGFIINPGEMGENITTKGIDLLALSKGCVISIGKDVKVEITGLRNPCDQLNGLHEGLLNAVLDKSEEGKLIRKAGVMGVVLTSGTVKTGDKIHVFYQPKKHQELERV